MLWHTPFVLLIGAGIATIFLIPDFGSVDDRAPTIGSLFAFFGVPELRADKAMPVFFGAWGTSGLGLNTLGMYGLDSYPWWFAANALVTGLVVAIGAVALFAKLTRPKDPDAGGDESQPD